MFRVFLGVMVREEKQRAGALADFAATFYFSPHVSFVGMSPNLR